MIGGCSSLGMRCLPVPPRMGRLHPPPTAPLLRRGPLGNAPIGHAHEKYDEIKETEAPHFPKGEQSVTEQWDRAGAALPAAMRCYASPLSGQASAFYLPEPVAGTTVLRSSE